VWWRTNWRMIMIVVFVNSQEKNYMIHFKVLSRDFFKMTGNKT